MFRALGLPKPAVTPEVMEALKRTKVNPTGELAQPAPIIEAANALDRLHQFAPTEDDRKDKERQFGQMKGQFLMDREGIVRWANVECAHEGLAGLGRFPGAEELLGAARAIA